ncbi:MAG: hypothetical protein EXR71_17620 [Myxococcales bacterium]|nr:hypothetical protein [Myxococcales bacterium]
MFGCVENSEGGSAGDGTGASETEGDSGDVGGGTEDSETDATFVAAWYTLEAKVVVEAGAGTTTDATVELVVVNAELVVGEEPCSLDVSDLAIATPPSGAQNAGLLAWWTLAVQSDDDCVPVGVPATLGFGLGRLDVEVRARLGTVNLDDEADQLYGAWLSADDGASVFPFGYAAPPAGMSDVALPNGAYALEPLLLLALSAAE